MECKDFEPSIIQDNEIEYINISKAFSSSLVKKADASIALKSFVPNPVCITIPPFHRLILVTYIVLQKYLFEFVLVSFSYLIILIVFLYTRIFQ